MRNTIFALASVHYAAASVVPNQVHIALAGKDENGNHNKMAVSWQTEENTLASEVTYGTKPGTYEYTSSGYSSTCKFS